MSTTLRECGELRVTGTEDAKLVNYRLHPRNARAFRGEVIWEGDDVRRRFAHEIYRVNLGTKSCLAQLGIFGAIAPKGKTMYPDVEVTDDRIVAKIRGSQYSEYPVELWEGMEFGRFFNVVGAPLSRRELLQVMSEKADTTKPVYRVQEGSIRDIIDEDGGLTLTVLPRAFRVRPDLDQTERIRVSSRRHLKEIFQEEPLTDNYEICQGEFIVTDTPRLIMPPGYSGLLKVDQLGDMAQPAHLNSPIVDDIFGHSDPEVDPYSGHLRLELYQPHPHPVPLKEVFVRLYFYRAKVITTLAPDSDGQDKIF